MTVTTTLPAPTQTEAMSASVSPGSRETATGVKVCTVIAFITFSFHIFNENCY